MSLRLSAALAAVTELHDLPQLLAALGHEPLWQELPPLAGVRHAATIGRRGAFTWLGIEADSSAVEAARRALRLLGTKGRLSGVIAFYPGGREIAIATAFERPEVLRLSLDAPDPVGLACLERLRASSGGTAAAYAARAADALAGRGAGREFFRQFRTTLDAMSDAIGRSSAAGGPRDPAARRNLALLQLTRVLFLYFVQSKGWLDGRPDFLARSVDDCLARGHRLHRDFLRPLFFGTLNSPVADRSAAVRRFGEIPFLNGGLFEPHPLERRFRFTLPDLEWRDAFDHLFERFHFTVSEAAPDGSAVAPDMLGHVFEGVMEPADRKASGTFYTPAVLVRRVVDAGINALVASRLGCSDADAERRLAAADPAALTLLADVTVLDPACGSGAFLLGALERLAAFRTLSGESPTDARRAVLQRNLFGVDLDAMAVRLAELRLWLAVVAEDPAVAAGAVRPLPNLDCLVRQGDSLIEPHGAGSGIDPSVASQIGKLRARLVTAAGREKRPIMTALRQVELQAAVSGSEAHERRLRHAVAELIEAARAPSLFGDRPRLTTGARARIKALRAELRETRSVCRRMRRSGEVPWFHYASHFADVMERGGFDIVVGNPPWVRAEDLPMMLRERLAARYRWWRAGYGLAERAGARTAGFAHQPDLSVAFLERAHELAAPGAAVSLLVPSKIAAAGYAGIVRGALATTATMHAVADLAGDRRGTFAATVYPMALVTTNRRPRESHCVRASLDAAAPATTRQRDLGAEPWIIGADAVAAIIQRLRCALPALGDRFRFGGSPERDMGRPTSWFQGSSGWRSRVLQESRPS